MIGFTHRVQTASESLVPSGQDLVLVNIAVSVSRRAQRDHPMVFRYEESTSTAVVEPENEISNPLFDAVFGVRNTPDDPIGEEYILQSGEIQIPPLRVSIRNDFRPEEDECFTINILPVDVPGHVELFSCNADSVDATDYFCKHTICITDDDSKFFEIQMSLLVGDGICFHFIFYTGPFVVAFVRTTYTVEESVGAVNICVNLTQPMIDILDETVNVFVIDDSSSIYIPDGAPLAS